jgi:hypothetical protein
VPIHRLAIAFAWGARTGVRRMRMFSLAKTASKTPVNLLRQVPDQELDGRHAVAEVYQEVACLLGDPCFVRVRRDAQEVDAAGGVLHDEQHVEPVEEQCVGAEEVGGEYALGLRAQELPPTWSIAARCGVHASLLQD